MKKFQMSLEYEIYIVYKICLKIFKSKGYLNFFFKLLLIITLQTNCFQYNFLNFCILKFQVLQTENQGISCNFCENLTFKFKKNLMICDNSKCCQNKLLNDTVENQSKKKKKKKKNNNNNIIKMIILDNQHPDFTISGEPPNLSVKFRILNPMDPCSIMLSLKSLKNVIDYMKIKHILRYYIYYCLFIDIQKQQVQTIKKQKPTKRKKKDKKKEKKEGKKTEKECQKRKVSKKTSLVIVLDQCHLIIANNFFCVENKMSMIKESIVTSYF
ncbi:hypothetical protein KUTeg_017431 [Tegillarca granosa]|uniref:Uncharacterized protein n=1 Tax=Tegillarca granosa TaxID=220873 RepID=A0ABQ9EEW2_TEGGR|nr:hypothetical protein KUTeg_017431 [Tegillarca granosa]